MLGKAPEVDELEASTVGISFCNHHDNGFRALSRRSCTADHTLKPTPRRLCSCTSRPFTSSRLFFRHLCLRSPWAAIHPRAHKRGGQVTRGHSSSSTGPRQRRHATTSHTVLSVLSPRKPRRAANATAASRARHVGPHRRAEPLPTSTTAMWCFTFRAHPMPTTTTTSPHPTYRPARAHVQYRGPRRANGRTCCPWTCHGARRAARPATAADARARDPRKQTTPTHGQRGDAARPLDVRRGRRGKHPRRQGTCPRDGAQRAHTSNTVVWWWEDDGVSRGVLCPRGDSCVQRPAATGR